MCFHKVLSLILKELKLEGIVFLLKLIRSSNLNSVRFFESPRWIFLISISKKMKQLLLLEWRSGFFRRTWHRSAIDTKRVRKIKSIVKSLGSDFFSRSVVFVFECFHELREAALSKYISIKTKWSLPKILWQTFEDPSRIDRGYDESVRNLFA